MNSQPTGHFRPQDERTLAAYFAEQPGATAAFLRLRPESSQTATLPEHTKQLITRDVRYLLKLVDSDPQLYGWELFDTIAIANFESNDLAIDKDQLALLALHFADITILWWKNLTFEQQLVAFFSLCQIIQLLTFRLPNTIIAHDGPQNKTLGVLASEHLAQLNQNARNAADDSELGMWATMILRSQTLAFGAIPEAYIPAFGQLDHVKLKAAHDAYRGDPPIPSDLDFPDPCRQRLSFDPYNAVNVEGPGTLLVDDLAVTGPRLAFVGPEPAATLTRNYALSQRNLAVAMTSDPDRAADPGKLIEDATFVVQLSGRDGLQAGQFTNAEDFRLAYEHVKALYPNLPERFDPKPDSLPMTLTVTSELTKQHLELIYPKLAVRFGLGDAVTRTLVESFVARQIHSHGEPGLEELLAAEASLPPSERAHLTRLFPDAYSD